MIIVDIEASGTDIVKHSILSIGALDFDNPKNQFYEECRIFEGAHVMKEALEVNGFTENEIKDPKKQTDGELVKHFIAWSLTCKERTCAGQNPSFDRDFIQRAAIRNHIDWPFAYRTIDLHSLCFMHMIKSEIVPPVINNRTDLNSDRIMEYVGLPKESKPHKALNCTKTAAEAISRLLYDKKLLPEFKNYDIPWLYSKKAKK